MGSFPPSNSGDQNAQRRSQRVMVKVSVMVLTEGADKKSVSEETRNVTVNAHGAKMLTLRNSGTGEEVACRVVYVSPHESEKRQVGVDFMNPCPRFWRISFPPPDWTTQSPEAKGSPRRPASTPKIQNGRNEVRPFLCLMRDRHKSKRPGYAFERPGRLCSLMNYTRRRSGSARSNRVYFSERLRKPVQAPILCSPVSSPTSRGFAPLSDADSTT